MHLQQNPGHVRVNLFSQWRSRHSLWHASATIAPLIITTVKQFHHQAVCITAAALVVLMLIRLVDKPNNTLKPSTALGPNLEHLHPLIACGKRRDKNKTEPQATLIYIVVPIFFPLSQYIAPV